MARCHAGGKIRGYRPPTTTHATTIRLGRRARIADIGLRTLDVAIAPGAAGRPKGLILHQLDCWLFGDFLAQAPRRLVRGIGVLAQPGKWRDRRGIPRYAQDHAARMRDWRQAGEL